MMHDLYKPVPAFGFGDFGSQFQFDRCAGFRSFARI